MNEIFDENTIVINSSVSLEGSLTTPKGDDTYPAVLFIGGSGPLDRNGNGPNGKYETNLYKELAHFISKLGFITLRYDKRGTGKSDGKMLHTGLWDLVEDAQAAYLYLKSHPSVDKNKIIVIGHSEGTIIGTALAERQPVNGLLFVSGGVSNLEEFLREQRLLSYKELKESKGLKGILMRKLVNEDKSEKKIKRQMNKIITSNKDVFRVQFFFKQPAKWFREHYSYNTREGLKKVTCPILIIQGDKDPLVNNETLKELPNLVNGSNTTFLIKDMEHGLRIQKEPKSILNLKKLFKDTVNRPLHEDALSIMSKWLTDNFKEEN